MHLIPVGCKHLTAGLFQLLMQAKNTTINFSKSSFFYSNSEINYLCDAFFSSLKSNLSFAPQEDTLVYCKSLLQQRVLVCSRHTSMEHKVLAQGMNLRAEGEPITLQTHHLTGMIWKTLTNNVLMILNLSYLKTSTHHSAAGWELSSRIHRKVTLMFHIIWIQ